MAAVLGILVVAPGVTASDVHGNLQGADGLTPTALPDNPRFRGAYWDLPNGVVRPGSPHASTEWDIPVILTGPGLPEATQPVNILLEGGRCRPGTVVVTPGTVVQIDNQDLLGHELYAIPRGGGDRVVPAEVTSAGTRREVSFPAAGVYEFRDLREPALRCWIIAGPGQGRVVSPAADGSFSLVGLADGDYTLRGYYEGIERGSVPLHLTGRDTDVTLPLGGPPNEHRDSGHGREH